MIFTKNHKELSSELKMVGRNNKSKFKLISYLTPEILLVLILFVLNPFICLIFTIFLALFKNSYFYNKILIVLLSVFIGLINLTKHLESDLLVYQNDFYFASDLTFIDYLNYFNKEYLFYTINYVLNYVLMGNWKMYLLIIVAFPYYLLLSTINKLFFKLTYKKEYLILALINIAFFYPLFNYSAHLVRNFISASIVFYIVINYFFYNKRKPLLLISSILIHSTTLFFCYLFVIPNGKKKKYTNRYILKYLSIIVLGFGLVYAFSNVIMNDYIIRE